MRSPCREILPQNYAPLAISNPLHPNLSTLTEIFAAQDLEEGYRGLIPSCAGDYAGSERFWSEGWSYKPEPEASDVAGLLEEAPGVDFLVHNPGTALELAELLDDSHLASCNSNTSTVVQ